MYIVLYIKLPKYYIPWGLATNELDWSQWKVLLHKYGHSKYSTLDFHSRKFSNKFAYLCQTHCASSHNQKENNKFKNKKQPELTGNQTVWKTDNQGVKEETFIQTGRRGRDRQTEQRRLSEKQGMADQSRQQLDDSTVRHLCADKLVGTAGDQDRLSNPGFQCRELKPQNLWLKTPVDVEVAAEETPSLTEEFVGETHRVLNCTKNPPTWESAPEGPNLIVSTGGND